MKGFEKEERRFKYLLYIIIFLTIVTMILPVVSVGVTTYDQAKSHVEKVVGGKVIVDADGEVLEHQIDLNGDWLCYEGVYLNNTSEISGKIKGEEGCLEKLPESNLNDATGQKTYQLFLDIRAEQTLIDDLAISMEFTNENVKVFLNEVELESYRPMKSWLGGGSAYNMYLFSDAYDYTSQYQEVLISVNKNPESTDLYRRVVSLGTTRRIMEQSETTDVLQMFMVGLMILSIALGMIYLVMVPSYSVLTFINLFDASLMIYIYYNFSRIPGVISSYTLGEFQDSFIRGQSLMLLFFAGALGNILGQVIFDPHREANRMFNAPVNAVWFIMAFVFVLFPEQYGNKMLLGTLVLLCFNYIGLLQKIWLCYKSERWNAYLMFHMFKTFFIGSIITYDVMTLNTYPRNEAVVVLGYVIFFIMHFFVRAYEYMIPFKEVEKHNEGLELAVQERTQQLMEANEILREVNIKDGLTKAYNRLHFEEELDEILERYKNESNTEGLYLCIFDLDNFKRINDTFGHSVGDEQLIELVKLCVKLLPKDVKVSRIGGEEFTLLFDGYYEDSVLKNVESVRIGLEKVSSANGRTTGSFGLAKYKAGDTRKTFFVNADRCLYHSKENGKNCISHDFEKDIVKL